ncbi:hypothetical protein EDB81DRAFT_507255 [Dactylonectria macrodidyma]|uniref:Zn(2)-C6 fungal-type domain-containing protein n=1 Tax=Dactylonectria macrodidyma TaxID=307937 RepID=A0A9P9EP62_9HYPO|nr:hypothetical protein EDB81DRAFT_507255 [Dactylonectria macrodidyma]
MDDHLMSRGDTLSPLHDEVASKTRACSNCARLKMKCQWNGAGSTRSEKTCARCARMKLPCQVPEAVPRKKRGKSTRVAQLEKKLDGIVSLLAASQAAKGPSPLTPESPKAVPIIPPPSVAVIVEKPIGQFIPSFEPPPPVLGGHLGSGPSELELFPGFRLTLRQAAEHLDAYRRDFVPVYPFVTIAEDMTAQGLYAHSPVLFWSVMAVVVPLPKETQQDAKVWFRKYLAEQVVVKQERSLDMLQATLIHLAWNDFPFYLDPQATPLVQLALSLIMDMRLDKSPSACIAPHKSLLGDAWPNMIKSSSASCGYKVKTTHTLEEKRAVLGYYHISSLLSVLFRRGTQLPWSHFLSQCCDALLEADEYKSDPYLVSVVRMQHIADRAYNALRTTDYYDNRSIVFRAPLDMAMSQARRELDAFVETQPPVVKETRIFWSHYYILLVRLYEPVLFMKAPPVSDHDSLVAEPFMRAEALWKCVQACGQFFNHHLTIPDAEHSALPVTASGFIAFGIVTVSRIMLLDSAPDWDPALARRHLDVPGLLARMADAYERADGAARGLGRRRRILDDGGSVFLKYSFKLRWVRQWFLSRIVQQQPPLAEAETEAAPQPDWAVDFEFDEDFWQELMSAYDCDDLNLSLPTAPVA